MNNPLTSQTKTIKCLRTSVDDNVKEGDHVKLWVKPNSADIYIFAKGSVGGQGKLGTFTDKHLKKQLENKQQYKVTAEVLNLSDQFIELVVAVDYTNQPLKTNSKTKWEKCPRCESPRTQYKGTRHYITLGILTLSFSLWLVFLLPFIGIPLMLFGVAFIIAAFILPKQHVCKDCKNRWKAAKK